MGARPFERLFEEKVKVPLSTEILFGGLKEGGRANVDVDIITDEIKVVIMTTVIDPVII
jgi:ATP-dependent Clp protease ATP-binding subunit ClpA